MNEFEIDSLPSSDITPLTFRIAEDEAGVRLDAFLADHIEGWSRSRLQKLIEDGEILVGGRIAKASYKLRANDLIEADLVPASANFTPENIPLHVVFEDSTIAVINKPPGLIVHPAGRIQSGTLANALAFHFSNLSSNSGPVRPGIVHRLDRDTSGLMVVAKTGEAHENLADQFRERQIFKQYRALVYGQLAGENVRIEAPIARDPQNRSQMAVVAGGRPSLSVYTVDRSFGRFTLLNVEIRTGRTHQIRVHLASIKHPVVGDKVYSAGRENTISNPQIRAALRKLDRQFLHAAKLGFQHPSTGERLLFESPLPEDLTTFITVIESDADVPKS